MPPPNHSSNKGNDDINFRAIVPVAIDLDLLEKEKKIQRNFCYMEYFIWIHLILLLGSNCIMKMIMKTKL